MQTQPEINTGWESWGRGFKKTLIGGKTQNAAKIAFPIILVFSRGILFDTYPPTLPFLCASMNTKTTWDATAKTILRKYNWENKQF